MPGFDGTGPRGMGPRTGGGRGFCPPIWPGMRPFGGWPSARWPTPPVAQAPYPYYGTPAGTSYYGATPASRAIPYSPQMTKEQELDFLRSQAEMMRSQLEQIESRVRELE